MPSIYLYVRIHPSMSKCTGQPSGKRKEKNERTTYSELNELCRSMEINARLGFF